VTGVVASDKKGSSYRDSIRAARLCAGGYLHEKRRTENARPYQYSFFLPQRQSKSTERAEKMLNWTVCTPEQWEFLGEMCAKPVGYAETPEHGADARHSGAVCCYVFDSV
jgi:hypothetical protein